MNEQQTQFKYIDLPVTFRPYLTKLVKTDKAYCSVGCAVIPDIHGFSGYIYAADNIHNLFLINISSGEVIIEDYEPLNFEGEGNTSLKQNSKFWPSQAEQDNFILEVI